VFLTDSQTNEAKEYSTIEKKRRTSSGFWFFSEHIAL